jgi:transposase
MDTMMPDRCDVVESAHTIGRTSARPDRVEILPHAERRRSWTAEQKLAIVGESLGAELTPTEVARKHRISTGQIYTWRQQFLGCESSSVSRTAARFTAVNLVPACPPSPPLSQPALCSLPEKSPRPEGLIEIMLADGISIRVDAHVDGRALRRVLGALAE